MVAKKIFTINEKKIFFGALLLTNLPVLFLPIWLLPGVVYFVVACWVLLALFASYRMTHQGLLPAAKSLLKNNWFIFPFVAYSAISLLWSVVPEVSLARWVTLVCVILVGAYLGMCLRVAQIADSVAIFGAFLLMLSFAIIISAPSVGIMNYYSIQGAWKGLFWHKNHLGLLAVFFNFLFLMKLLESFKWAAKEFIVWSIFYLFSLFSIYMSDSAAAYITFLLMHVFIFLAYIYIKYKEKLNKIHYVSIASVLALSGLIVLLNIDFVFGLFNRNSTLTGRVPMWSYLFDLYLSKRPFFGYGFNAFWYVLSHQVALGRLAHYPEPIIIADNGFIDILINGGFLGLLLFAFFYFGTWWRIISFSVHARNLSQLFPITFMVYMFFANLTWSLLFENESLLMLVMVVTLFSISSYESTQQEDLSDGLEQVLVE